MVEFNALRLSGFKSFVEPTELLIEPGLTGVIGPNGCGKSNLVEALRWAMGETSPKSMRGTGMEDVIFSGTTNRPARNMAEVTLALGNSDRTAPAAFNDSDDLEITRRIERGAGSGYRINGNDVRARDVQLLFADSSTGAHSPALVSQGRVGALISAKPKDRRSILEEAAGITGLHSRRHEAELRLRAAETNLTRLDDVMAQIETQLGSLKRQARQANRYRNLQGHIRRHEALLLHLKWTEARLQVEESRAKLKKTEAEVATATQAAAEAARVEALAQHGLPPLREKEAEMAAALHRLSVERDGLAKEEERARQKMAELEGQLTQIDTDLEREGTLAKDAASALERLDAEKETLDGARAGEADRIAEAQAAVTQAQETLRTDEDALHVLTERAAALAARRSGFEREIRETGGRLERLVAQLSSIEEEKAKIERELREDEALAAARTRLAESEAALSAAQEAQIAAEDATRTAEQSESAARDRMNEARNVAHRIKAEEQALTNLLDTGSAGDYPPMVDELSVEPGYEKALGAALGDDLDVSFDPDAPAHWAKLGEYADNALLPDGVVPLSDFVKAPAALKRRLSHIGLVEDRADGGRLHGLLKPGQRIVTRDGDLWRWDGLTSAADAPSAAAKRLEQRNRLSDLIMEREVAERTAEDATKNHDGQKQVLDAAKAADQNTRKARRSAEDNLSNARRKLAEFEQVEAKRQTRLQSLTENAERLTQDRTDSESRLAEAKEGLGRLEPQETLDGEISAKRAHVDSLRAGLAEARSNQSGLQQEAQARATRLSTISRERQAWVDRSGNSIKQIEALNNRKKNALAQQEELHNLPEHLKAKRTLLLDKIGEAEQNRRDSADKLAEAESLLAEAGKWARAVNEALGTHREDRAKISGHLEGAEERLGDSAARIHEVLQCPPQKALELAELKEGETPPPANDVEDKLEKLKRERENMGAVNLRAEEESRELTEQLEGMEAEKADLEGAIARLRGGIQSLNKEGRERLLTAFESVNEKFTRLFGILFGGGTAHLELIESDDPLSAGLEIYASPPGKKLQVMTLLSGGEQALTALALIFAVFLTNPSPICVLDEVDAPLDDANVERFTNLVETIAKETGTRFLIITHHAVTMARMHRLFGVTMAERGVSQLVSVSLEHAEEMIAAE